MTTAHPSGDDATPRDPAVLDAGAVTRPAYPVRRGTERIAMVIYPGFTALDLFGPHNMLAGILPAKLDLVARTSDPVMTDTGVKLLPTATYDEIADGLDVLFVPGGTLGTVAAMRDAPLQKFLVCHGASARYVTSVCTGSLVLGKAGLLYGYRATSHWVTLGILPMFGATPIAERVVTDRNRITGAGVSAGLDLGLLLVGVLRDRAYAERVQLAAEYDPHPPFDTGSPAKAGDAATAQMTELFGAFVAEARRAGAEG